MCFGSITKSATVGISWQVTNTLHVFLGTNSWYTGFRFSYIFTYEDNNIRDVDYAHHVQRIETYSCLVTPICARETSHHWLNSPSPRQNGRRFADDIFRYRKRFYIDAFRTMLYKRLITSLTQCTPVYTANKSDASDASEVFRVFSNFTLVFCLRTKTFWIITLKFLVPSH